MVCGRALCVVGCCSLFAVCCLVVVRGCCLLSVVERCCLLLFAIVRCLSLPFVVVRHGNILAGGLALLVLVVCLAVVAVSC